MKIDYSMNDKVTFTMYDYTNKTLTSLPDNMKAILVTPLEHTHPWIKWEGQYLLVSIVCTSIHSPQWHKGPVHGCSHVTKIGSIGRHLRQTKDEHTKLNWGQADWCQWTPTIINTVILRAVYYYYFTTNKYRWQHPLSRQYQCYLNEVEW